MRAAWWDLPPPRDARAAADAAAPVIFPGGAAAPVAQSANVAPFPMGMAGAPGYGQFPPSRRGRVALAKKLLEENAEDLTWIAARVGVHPTTLYRWRKTGRV
jgi:hypothetical protein